MARTVLDVDDAALARAAVVLGTSTKVETDEDGRRRFDDLLALLGDRLAETDVRSQAWR